MNIDIVSNRNIIADMNLRFFIKRMQHSTILNIDMIAYPNRIHVTSHYSIKPHTTVVTQHRIAKGRAGTTVASPLPRKKVILAVTVLLLLIFSKYFYMASISSYFTFYLMHKFGLSVQSAQLHLLGFLFAVAAGTVIGGPVGDRIGRKYVIWGSILGVAPFTLVLPYASLFWTGILVVIIGFILASAFSAILVYAQELVPGNVGMIAGIFFGLMFGFGGIGAALLGHLADIHGIEYVYTLCSYLPLFGVLAILLPRTKKI